MSKYGNTADDPPRWSTKNTTLRSWFERDRAIVELDDDATGKTICRWIDEDVAQAMEDGFLPSPHGVAGANRTPGFDAALHAAAVEYANDMGFELWMVKA